MAQVRKDKVELRIQEAALRIFAREGFGAPMKAIAEAAGISTGNIYRYYPSKEALFEAVLTLDFPEAFQARVLRRVDVLAGTVEVPPGSPYFLQAEALLRFCIEQRWRVVILLARAEGTRYDGFAAHLEALLVERAIRHVQSPVPESMRFNLQKIYRNLMNVLVDTLLTFEDDVAVREAVEAYSRFHLAGLKALFSA